MNTTASLPFVGDDRLVADDDSLLYQSDALTQLGEIKLEIDRVMILGSKAFRPSDSKLPDDGKVHERCKKLGGHRIRRAGNVL